VPATAAAESGVLEPEARGSLASVAQGTWCILRPEVGYSSAELNW
jgi:hypothetical protein